MALLIKSDPAEGYLARTSPWSNGLFCVPVASPGTYMYMSVGIRGRMIVREAYIFAVHMWEYFMRSAFLHLLQSLCEQFPLRSLGTIGGLKSSVMVLRTRISIRLTKGWFVNVGPAKMPSVELDGSDPDMAYVSFQSVDVPMMNVKDLKLLAIQLLYARNIM